MSGSDYFVHRLQVTMPLATAEAIVAGALKAGGEAKLLPLTVAVLDAGGNIVLLKRQDDVFLPGHGPMLRDPRKLVQELKDHRQMRENAIAEKLKEGPANTYTLMDSLYSQVNPRLRRAAERNVLAHLQKMEIEGKVQRDGELWRAA